MPDIRSPSVQNEKLTSSDFEGPIGMKIVAAVVTYNRRELLGRCIDHLLSQTRAPDKIIIINNSSTDGTVDMPRARGVAFITQENTGSAGGWRRSIQYATDEEYDAVWLMDDDGFPRAGALAALESAMVSDVACASSVVLQENRPTHFVFPMPLLNRNGLPVIFGWPRKIDTLAELRARAPAGEYPFAHLFNGSLISVAVVREIGNVDPSFFIFGEEVDYFFRMRAYKRVISVLDATQMHPDVTKRPFTSTKIYYYIKNSLILNARHFDFGPVRNLLTVAAAVSRTAQRNGLGAALSYVFGANSPMFYRAIGRGLFGQTGKDFLD
jgi:rhamnopyranosyl-N-acetylglucosaminyl-diphospho-decaprenol beta-1,3/1,4-galactofuranosyltransferase